MRCPKCNGNIGYMEAVYITEGDNLKNLNSAEKLLKQFAHSRKFFKEVSKIYCSKCFNKEMLEENETK